MTQPKQMLVLPLVDAAALRGVPIDETEPLDGQVLIFDSDTGELVYGFVSGSGGGGGAPTDAQYLTLATNGSLSGERVLTPGTGLVAADGGAGSSYTLGISNAIVATISGSTFAQISGSLQRTAAGLSYLVGGASVSVTSASNGQVTLAVTAPGSTGNPVLNSGGSLSHAANFTFTGGRLDANSAGAFSGSFSGSLTQVTPGVPFISAPTGNAITVSTGALGQVVLSSPTYAPTSAQYVTLATDSTLSQERVLTAGNGMVFVNGGAGGSLTVRIADVVSALTNSLSYSPAGAGTLTLLHSGTTVTTFDSLFRVHDLKGRWQTTGAGTVNGVQFISGANGRSYAIDAVLQAQHTTTIETARWKLSAHTRMAGGSMVLVASDAALSSSTTPALSGTLALSGGNIVLQATAPSGTWNWGAALRVQELG